MSEKKDYLSVSELNERIKYILENEDFLSSIYLRGEISNFKIYPSGHAYFSLKDDSSLISAVMWSTYCSRLSFIPKNGDKVLVHGKITAYPPRGTYQLAVSSMQRDGEGDERKKLRELAEKLKKEGLFDESRKRPLPLFPERIAVIAGAKSAGLRDIEVNLLKRWPLSEVRVFPSLVQGAEAPKDLIASLEKAALCRPDVLIMGRGGGSSEDLAAFNDESLVRALAVFPSPVVSAVGHEIDVTLCDLVADERVSTPTAAVIACVPDQHEISQMLDEKEKKIDSEISITLNLAAAQIEKYASKPYFTNSTSLYKNHLDRLKTIEGRLDNGVKNVIEMTQKSLLLQKSRLAPRLQNLFLLFGEKLKSYVSRLESLNPEQVLSRGYSITMAKDGRPLKSKDQLSIGDEIQTKLKDGMIVSKVMKKEGKKNG